MRGFCIVLALCANAALAERVNAKTLVFGESDRDKQALDLEFSASNKTQDIDSLDTSFEDPSEVVLPMDIAPAKSAPLPSVPFSGDVPSAEHAADEIMVSLKEIEAQLSQDLTSDRFIADPERSAAPREHKLLDFGGRPSLSGEEFASLNPALASGGLETTSIGDYYFLIASVGVGILAVACRSV